MTEGTDRRGKITKWIRGVARIMSVPIILYALIFFVGYVWSWLTTGVADPHAVDDYPPIENLPPIFLFLGILALGVAWRWERLGGTIALLFPVASVVTLLLHRPIWRDFPRAAIPYLIVSIPTIPAVLFLVCARRAREHRPCE